MTPEELAAVTALVESQAEARSRVSLAVQAGAVASLLQGDDWYDSQAITGMARRIVRLVEPGQRQVAASTDGYLSRVSSLLAGRRVAPVGAGSKLRIAALRRGVSHEGVYGRLADQYRWLRSVGKSADEAQSLVGHRVEVVADMDIALASRDQEHRFMLVRDVDGWRRIIHPELSKGGSCGLCIVAADRKYTRGDLKPIHAGCHCEILPIINGVDPGLSLNKADLKRFYAEAGGTAAKKLKRTRYVVREHGEVGPVLVNAADEWRGPEDLPAAA